MTTNPPTLSAKFLGGMLGSALGDAMGNVAWASTDAANLRMDLDRVDSLSYTDDTAMAIGLAETLVIQGKLCEQQVGDCLRRIYQREPWRGYKSGPPTIFALVEEQGLSYRQAAARLGSTADCDAATRVAPVGLFFASAPDLYAQAALSAAVTHAHPVATDGAAVLAKAIAQVVSLSPAMPFLWQPWLRELIDFTQTRVLREQLERMEAMFAGHVTPNVAFDYLGRGSAVQSSLPFALYAFLWYPTSFEQCVLCAVTHGGEQEALGTMAGAVAGAYHGIKAIPKDWQIKLENRGYLERLARTLAAKASSLSGKMPYFSIPRLGQWN